MNLELDGKAILVAGASRGVGLGIAEALLAEGARVALTARGADALNETRDRLADIYGHDRLAAFAGDMRESETIDRVIAQAEEQLGPLWGAVANVGLYPCPP